MPRPPRVLHFCQDVMPEPATPHKIRFCFKKNATTHLAIRSFDVRLRTVTLDLKNFIVLRDLTRTNSLHNCDILRRILPLFLLLHSRLLFLLTLSCAARGWMRLSSCRV